MSDNEYSDVEGEGEASKPAEKEEASGSIFRQNRYDNPSHYGKKFSRHPNPRNYEPKIEVEFTGVKEGDKFDFNSEEINFAFCGDLLQLYADEDDEDVEFEHFVIRTYRREPKAHEIFDSTIIDNLKNENIIAMRPSQIATMMVAFFSAPYTVEEVTPTPTDFVCISSTGSGKTIAYLTPMIQKCMDRIEANPNEILRTPTVLIFAHTNSLVINIYQTAKKIAEETGVKIELIAGGQKWLKSTNFDIGICTMGRFLTYFQENVPEDRVKINVEDLQYLVVDEADVLTADLEFRKIVTSLKRKNNQFSIFLYSATINNTVHSMINEKKFYAFGGGSINQVSASIQKYFWPVSTKALTKITGFSSSLFNIGQYENQVLRHPFDALYLFLKAKLFNKSSNKKKVIVFMKRTIIADLITQKLNIIGFPAISVHGKQSFRTRQILLQKFINGEVRILLATNLLTRGTDIDVEYVVNYDLPIDYANWVHRCGRTGRNQKLGAAITFVDKENNDDYPKLTLQQIALHLDKDDENAPKFMKDFAEQAREQLEKNKKIMDDSIAEEFGEEG
uniref:ATP-dependent RNA helicase n=1 Tax=Panagrolaimus davidi TaxID=227884 RepID=A0A914QW88_9BILA